jgi:hypothetical protein
VHNRAAKMRPFNKVNSNMPTCPNLRELFGDRFRIGHDPVAETYAERNDPWMMTIPCRGGAVIYPRGAHILALEVDYRPHLAKRLAAIPGVVLHQDGDREKTFLFPVALFDRVAKLVHPLRRRRLSPQQREANSARLARFRFPSARQSGISTLEPHNWPVGDPQAVGGQKPAS